MSERWMLATWPGVGADGPWLAYGDTDLIELGARARDWGTGVERDRLYSVTRDGEVLVTGLTNSEAFAWLLAHQGQSVDWAMKYEGYAIVDEGRSVPHKSE